MKLKYNINHYVSQLPREVSIDDLIKALKRAGVSKDSFYRARAMTAKSSQSISTDSLAIYAQLFNCKMDDLINQRPKKIRPMIKP